MTLRKRIADLGETSLAHRMAVVAPKGLVERLAVALTDSHEGYDIREIIHAWEVERSQL